MIFLIWRRNRTYVYSQRIAENIGTLVENTRTSNVRIHVFIHSQYSSWCAEFILGTSKFVELTNFGEYTMWKSVLAITRQFMWERPRILTNIRNSPILRELAYVWFRLYAEFCSIKFCGRNIHFLVNTTTHCLETRIISTCSLAVIFFLNCEWSRHLSSYTSHASEHWILLPFFFCLLLFASLVL